MTGPGNGAVNPALPAGAHDSQTGTAVRTPAVRTPAVRNPAVRNPATGPTVQSGTVPAGVGAGLGGGN